MYLDVWRRGTMFMLCSSWNNSLQAYGILILAMEAEVFLQYWHHPLYPIRPHSVQTSTLMLEKH